MPKSAGSKRLFTVIMDFEGTTSAAQFRTSSVHEALRLWLNGLSQPKSYGLTNRQRLKLAGGVTGLDLNLAPSPLEGLQSIWCSTVSASGGGMALLNVIETIDRD
jgi:hypothetical protein